VMSQDIGNPRTSGFGGFVVFGVRRRPEDPEEGADRTSDHPQPADVARDAGRARAALKTEHVL
jgi:hypothetical protein